MVELREKDRVEETPASKGYLQHTVYRNLLQLRRLNLIVEQVLAYARSKQSDRLKILELGCGIGAISFPLSSLRYEVVGVDIDSSSISECNNRNSFPNARYAVADAETADLKEKFDVVIASEILEHCPYPYKVLETLGGHLRPDGIGIVTVPNGYCLSELIFSRLFQKIGIHSLFHKMPRRLYTLLTGSPIPYYSLNVSCHHIHFFTLKRFLRLLSSHGFKILSVHNLDLGLLLDWNCLSALKRLECKLAEFAPHTIAGGWVFVIKKGEE